MVRLHSCTVWFAAIAGKTKFYTISSVHIIINQYQWQSYTVYLQKNHNSHDFTRIYSQAQVALGKTDIMNHSALRRGTTQSWVPGSLLQQPHHWFLLTGAQVVDIKLITALCCPFFYSFFFMAFKKVSNFMLTYNSRSKTEIDQMYNTFPSL